MNMPNRNLSYSKMMLTLIATRTGEAVRVTLKPEFFEKALRAGMTQHWAVVHADTVPALLALADILGLEKVVI